VELYVFPFKSLLPPIIQQPLSILQARASIGDYEGIGEGSQSIFLRTQTTLPSGA